MRVYVKVHDVRQDEVNAAEFRQRVEQRVNGEDGHLRWAILEYIELFLRLNSPLPHPFSTPAL